jgi:hypothetical protein
VDVDVIADVQRKNAPAVLNANVAAINKAKQKTVPPRRDSFFTIKENFFKL